MVPWVIRLLHVTTVPMSLIFLEGHVEFMRDRGIEFYALSSLGPELDAFGKKHGVPTYAVPMARRITPLQDLRAVRQMAAVMRRIRPDIVHAHTPKGGLLGMIAATMARVPVRIYHMRGLPFQGATGMKHWLLQMTEWVACRLAQRVFCVSHSIRDVAVAERLCSAEKIAVPANGSGQGVDALGRFDPDRVGDAGRRRRAELAIPAEARVLGFVGRLVRDKGILELEEAWRQLRQDHPSLHLLLVGPWEDQDPVPSDVRDRLERDPRVHLLGLDWDTPSLYAAMDIVVLPTYREGFPNVALEAGAMGRPVVATRVPGCVDAIEDEGTGTLVPPQNAAALGQAVGSYLQHPPLARRHGARARQRVLSLFLPEQIYAAIHEEYLRLIEARSA